MRRSSTAPRASASGVGRVTIKVRTGPGDGKCRRYSYQGSAGGGGVAAREFSRTEDSLHHVVDLYKLTPGQRTSARFIGQGFRQSVTLDKPILFQLPRISLADPSPGLSSQQPQEPACARLQGKRQYQYAAGACHRERDRPFQPGDRRHSTASQLCVWRVRM